MNSNTHSISCRTGGRSGRRSSDSMALAAQDLDGLPDAALAEGSWPCGGCWTAWKARLDQRLAAVDGRGAAGAEQGIQAPSTASWLRARLHMGAGAASRSCVRTARALFRGPLTDTAQALSTASSRPPMPACWPTAPGPPRPGRRRGRAGAAGGGPPARPTPAAAVLAHLRWWPIPMVPTTGRAAPSAAGLWLAPTLEGMVALEGLLEPEAGQTLLAALEPLARPASADDTRSGGQRRADALAELARRPGSRPAPPERRGPTPAAGHRGPGQPPRPPRRVGGEVGGAGPLAPEACRRLACDGAVTRVLVTRPPPQPTTTTPAPTREDGPRQPWPR